MKNLILFTLSFFLSVSVIEAQTSSINKSEVLTETNPENVGISSERLARIDKMCNEEIENGNLPGIVSLVTRNGKIVHWKAYGMADNQSKRKLKRDDIFRIASQTKAITSTAVMMLWEEGKFKLDDPISKYIPEFKDMQILKTFQYKDTSWTGEPAKNQITIRHLLTHTSGIGYADIDSDERMKLICKKAGIEMGFSALDITNEENIKNLAKMPIHFEPGAKFKYSMGLDVLAYFVEVVSEMPFDKFLRSRIFEPLGMNDTWFYLPNEKADRLISIQQKVNGEWEKYPNTFYDTDYPVKGAMRLFSGGAGLSSTAKDYAIFLQMYLNKGEYNGVRLLSRTTVQAIMGNQIGELWGKDADKYHGLAFSVVTNIGQDMGGIGSTGTFIWGGYFNTQYFADPVENTIGILMKQTQGDVQDDTGWRFSILVEQSIDD